MILFNFTKKKKHTCVLLPSGRVYVSFVWCRRRPGDVILLANPCTSVGHSHKSVGYLRKRRKINKTLNFRDSGIPNISKRVIFIQLNRLERHNRVELFEIMSISVVINIVLCVVLFSIFIIFFILGVVYFSEWYFLSFKIYIFWGK